MNALLGDESAAAPPATETAGEAKVTSELPLDALEPNRYQPRTHFDSTGLDDLADSIRAQGVVQPIVVTPQEVTDKAGETRYTIIAGERRWRASRLAGLETVPVVVRQITSDQQLLEMALVENVQRADLNPIEGRGLQDAE